MDSSFFLPILQTLVTKYPWLLTVLTFIGISRLLMKPIFTLAISYLQLQPNPEKLQKVQALMNSKLWKTFAFIVDTVFSVKLPYLPGSVGANVQSAIQSSATPPSNQNPPAQGS